MARWDDSNPWHDTNPSAAKPSGCFTRLRARRDHRHDATRIATRHVKPWTRGNELGRRSRTASSSFCQRHTPRLWRRPGLQLCQYAGASLGSPVAAGAVGEGAPAAGPEGICLGALAAGAGAGVGLASLAAPASGTSMCGPLAGASGAAPAPAQRQRAFAAPEDDRAGPASAVSRLLPRLAYGADGTPPASHDALCMVNAGEIPPASVFAFVTAVAGLLREAVTRRDTFTVVTLCNTLHSMVMQDAEKHGACSRMQSACLCAHSAGGVWKRHLHRNVSDGAFGIALQRRVSTEDAEEVRAAFAQSTELASAVLSVCRRKGLYCDYRDVVQPVCTVLLFLPQCMSDARDDAVSLLFSDPTNDALTLLVVLCQYAQQEAVVTTALHLLHLGVGDVTWCNALRSVSDVPALLFTALAAYSASDGVAFGVCRLLVGCGDLCPDEDAAARWYKSGTDSVGYEVALSILRAHARKDAAMARVWIEVLMLADFAAVAVDFGGVLDCAALQRQHANLMERTRQLACRVAIAAVDGSLRTRAYSFLFLFHAAAESSYHNPADANGQV